MINLKIGIMGLVEQEWIATLSTINFDDIIYESYVDCGKRIAEDLRTKDVCSQYANI
jgi:5'-nucleotidase